MGTVSARVSDDESVEKHDEHWMIGGISGLARESH